jgi:hypothetical protein
MSDDDSTTRFDRRTALKTLGVAGLGASTLAMADDAAAAGPTADFTISPLPPEVGETVTFDASPSTGDIAKYEWYRQSADGEIFGVDGTGQTFTESFADGDFVTRLVVTDSDGNTDSVDKYFIVYDDVSPTPRIQYSKNSEGGVTFDGTFSSAPGDATIESYEWARNAAGGGLTYPDFTGPTFYERFADGDFDIGLRVTDSRGRTTEKQLTITV